MAPFGSVNIVPIGNGEVMVDWKIERFSEIPPHVNIVRHSPYFDISGSTWFLELVPNGKKAVTTQGYVGLHLYTGGQYPSNAAYLRFSMGIRSVSGKTEREVIHTRRFRGNGRGYCGTHKLIQKSDLLKRSEELLPGDILTLRVTLKSVCYPFAGSYRDGDYGPDARDSSVQTEVQGIAADNGTVEAADKRGAQSFGQEVRKMWSSDVIIKVGDEEFQAHKAILEARTPVLAAAFRHDALEKTSGVVEIEDCEPADFEQLMHYVYNRAPRNITAENARSLYVLADKYEVSEVKGLCLECMRDTLCVDTFCSTVALSFKHKEDKLLETAIDFFSRNMTRVVESVQWKAFSSDNPTWANEILLHALKMRDRKEERRADDDSSRA